MRGGTPVRVNMNMHLLITYRSGNEEEVVGVTKLRVSPTDIECFYNNHEHETVPLDQIKSFDVTHLDS